MHLIQIIIFTLHVFFYKILNAVDVKSDDEIVVAIPTYYQGEILSVVIVLKSEVNNWDKLIRRYCWHSNIDHISCNYLLSVAKSQVADPNEWKNQCASDAIQTCTDYLLNIVKQRPPEFITPYEMYMDGDTTLIGSDIDSLRHVSTLLNDRGCLSQDTSQYLRKHAAYIFPNDWQILHLSDTFQDTLHALVPCESRLYWGDGKWVAYPISRNKTYRYAETAMLRCKGDIIDVAKNTDYKCDTLTSDCELKWNLLCSSFWSYRIAGWSDKRAVPTHFHENALFRNVDSSRNNCIVYSFMHASNMWVLEDYLATDLRCEVHIFDPHPHYINHHQVHDNIAYHFGGICDTPCNVNNKDDDNYGSLLTYENILTILGHENSRIDVLKLDFRSTASMGHTDIYNGRELYILNDIAVNSPHLLNNIYHIYVSINICMDSTDSNSHYLHNHIIAQFYNEYFIKRHYRLWFRNKYNTNTNNSSRIIVNELFLKLGFVSDVCIYELGLYRESDSTIKINSDALISPRDTSARDRNMTNGVFFQSENSFESFSDYYTYIADHNMTIGIVQYNPTIHSEVIGPLVDLAYQAGFQHVIIYADPYDDSGNFQSQTMISIFQGWRQWDIRPCLRWSNESHIWDILIFITGDEVYRRHAAVPNVKMYKNRIIALHHHPKWVVDDIFLRNMFLTPALDKRQFIFPFVHIAKDEKFTSMFDVPDSDNHININNYLNKHCMILLGQLGDNTTSRDNMEGRKYKDHNDIQLFLSANKNNTIVNIARELSSLSSLLKSHSQQVIGLGNIRNEDLIYVLRHGKYIWVPTPRDSLYMSGCFASSISFAFAFKKILIMPYHLSEFYGISHLVVTYQNSILEVNFDNISEELIVSRMINWENGQSIQNVINLYHILSTVPHF